MHFPWVRVPMVFAVLGFLLWLLRVQNEPRSIFLEFSGVALAMLLVTIGIDSLFYGIPTCSVWRYFSMAVQGDPGHVFDTLPWYYYAPWILKYSIPPSAFAFFRFITLLTNTRGICCLIMFVRCVHTFIPHKECGSCTWHALFLDIDRWLSRMEQLFRNRYVRVVGVAALGSLVALNVIAMVVIATSPAGNGRVALAKKLHELRLTRTEITYIIGGMDSWRVRLPHFYTPVGLVQTSVDRSHIDSTFHAPNYVVAHEDDAALINERTKLDLQLITTTETAFNEQLLQWYSWGERPARWGLYKRQ